MAILDKLLVVVSANTKEFNSAMDGVANKTEQTQSAMGKVSAAGKEAGAALARGFAGAAVAAAGFAFSISKLGPKLKDFNGLVSDGTNKAFNEMQGSMDRAGRALAISLANGMAKASGGFIQLVEKITETVVESKVLELAFKGVGYIFSALATTIGKVVHLLSATYKAFQILAISSEIAFNKMEAFFGGMPESKQETYDLIDAMNELRASMVGDLSSAFDMSTYLENIEAAQVKTAALTNIEPPTPPRPPTWTEDYIKRVQAMRIATDTAIIGMRKVIEDDRLLGYAADLNSSQLDQELQNMKLERMLFMMNRTKEIENEKTAIINANLREQEMVQATHDANWESSQQYKLQYAAGVFGQLSSMMNSESEKMFKVGKMAAIAQALIDTYAGMTKAFAQGGFWGFAMAAAVGIAGFANVMKIKNTQFKGGGGGGGSAPAQPAMPAQAAGAAAGAGGAQSTNVNVTLIGESFGQSAVRSLIGQINGATSDNVRLNVSGRA